MNSIIITGRLVKDAEIITSKLGEPITKFCVADNGSKEPNYFDCIQFDAEQELKKGQLVSLVGKIRIAKYEGKLNTTVQVEDLTALGGEEKK